MHAIRLHAFGPPENLVYEPLALPEPGPDEARIAVSAAGVHLLDAKLRAGDDGPPGSRLELPHTPGREVAGVVDAIGAGVDGGWLGSRVVAHLGVAPRHGGYAERTIAPAAALHRLPGHVADDAAVAMIGTGRTTMGILEVAELRGTDVVIVTAAAGGIGSLLVQAARNVDACVVGLAGGEEKVARVQALGADVAVDYTRPDWARRVHDALGGYEPTVAFDSVGGTLGRELLGLLGLGGRLILIGWSSGSPTEITTDDLYAGGLTVSAALGPRIMRRPGGVRGLEEAALGALERGELTPAIDRFPLAEAAAAHAALEGRRTTGKVVLVT
ncbi:zinc-binding dehydrogenase [Conexibacter arvalis]|uniref:NADPH2:quinone reductase n=1 Tax=Conexibacter arvalis TaxID=912552 RepID=A0A840IEG9_9ACTN|nr:zinc-binding dehydrogenase [Conexibacter arvalis]MBB4662330.1 NADPH2:quinone reductase [Conexibacter arvalis]